MIRRFVRSVIHNATVTATGGPWPVSVQIDPVLVRAADLRPFEEIEIVNLETGARWKTWVSPAAEGSGEVRVAAGAGQHARRGDIVSVVSYGLLHDGQTLGHRAKVLTLDSGNRIVSLVEE